MPNYSQTVQNYKGSYVKNLAEYIHAHKNDDLDEEDFLKMELRNWGEVDIAFDGISVYQEEMFSGRGSNKLKIKQAAHSLGSDGQEILRMRSVKIREFLAKKLRAIQQKTEENFEDIENNFDSVDISKVYTHFYEGLVKPGYLSEDDLHKYLVAAFENKTFPPKRFSFQNLRTKNKVLSVFRDYYTTVAGKPHGKQPEYAALLGDYFEGYNTKTVSTNFSK